MSTPATDCNGLSTKEIVTEIRADVKGLVEWAAGQKALDLNRRLCDVEDMRLPKIERWQSWMKGGLAAIGTLATLTALIASGVIR